MRIHTLKDDSFNLDNLPDEIDPENPPQEIIDMRFTILDNSDPSDPDFKYIPLIFLKGFTCPALVLKIGEHVLKMPLDWHIIIGEEEMGDLEALPLTSINARDFKAFQFNSLSSYMPSFETIEILDVYSQVSWYAPKLKNGQFLAVPLDDSPQPKCVYFIEEVSRNCEIIDYGNLW